MPKKTPVVLGIASGIGAQKRGAEMGVWDLYYSLPQEKKLFFSKVIYTDDPSRKLQALPTWKNISLEANTFIQNKITSDDQALFFTGDHSSGFSVWNGMLNKYKGNMGLLWIDAHLDSHTLESSETKNIHGMPISHLLGKGGTLVNECNTYPLNPKNLCFIGTRDYEESELLFLQNLGVKIIFMKDITKENLSSYIHEAIKYISKNVDHFGISIDLDSFDPIEVSATGCFCPNGLWVKEVADALENISDHKKFCGLEISEYDSPMDTDKKTKHAILKLLSSIFTLES